MITREDLKVSSTVLLCIMVNFFGKGFAATLGLPIWFDGVGTAVAACLLGPFCGATVGVASNIVYGFSDPMAYIYALTSAAIGISIGICAKRGMFQTFFGALSAGFIVTLISITISTPLNCIFFQGALGNAWGDGILAMLKNWGINWVFASFVAEFYIEFLDKFVLTVIIYLFVREQIEIEQTEKLSDYMKQKLKDVSFVLVGILAAGMFMATPANAAQERVNYNSYIQTVYNKNSGLLSGEANDIKSMPNGVLWIGTYAGLYRYNGREFSYINDWPSVKNVNCLYVDEEGRLWIGTNDSGVSVCIADEVVNVIDTDMGMPANSIRSMVQLANGKYFIGTSDALAVVSLASGMRVQKIIPQIVYASCLAADQDNHVAAVTASGDLYVLEDEEIMIHIKPDENESFTSCLFGEDGKLYVGTEAGYVQCYTLEAQRLNLQNSISCAKLGAVNRIMCTERGDFFICGEGGIGYLENGNACRYINSLGFNNSIDAVTEDYQGNLWFASSRLGIMKMCESPFTDLFAEAGIEDKVTNTICHYEGQIYVGTDDGLIVIDETRRKRVSNELTSMLNGVRIRSIQKTTDNHMWIYTYGCGVLKVSRDGTVKAFETKDGMLGSKFRCGIELEDGVMAVSGELGISFIKGERVIGTIGEQQGLTNTIVLGFETLPDGSVLAATDGGGIFRILDGKIAGHFGREDGLGSDVVLRIVKDAQNDAVFAVTSNGISYIEHPAGDAQIKVFDRFPYSNNYELYDNGQGTLFVTGSAGIYVVDKQSLLNGGEVDAVLLNHLSGLTKSLTANARNEIDDENCWYLATANGVTVLNLDRYQSKVRSYRMRLREVVVDGVSHKVENSEIVQLPQGGKRLVLRPEIINYSTKDPFVSYQMEGVDDAPIVVRQSELSEIVYSNLPAGEHAFRIAILNDEMTGNREEVVYRIQKDKEIYDNWWFRLYFVLELVLIIIWLTWYVTRSQLQRLMMIQKKEIELAKEQIEMGNETILAIARTVDAKDSNTSQHSTRVSEYSVLIAKKLGYSEEKQENLRRAALLHDIGKIGIPDRVLNKPGKLDDEEYEMMKSHVLIGSDILKDFTLIDDVQLGARYHHEKYDGTGYSEGLKGEEIPQMARIIGIADAFDAMTANRVYRKKLAFSTVIEELKKGSGTQFDPKLVDIMLELIEEGSIREEDLYGGKTV